MNSAKQVDALIEKWKASGNNKAQVAWSASLACQGWPYKFGARGQLVTKDGKEVRQFDCRGFTYWCLKQVGIELKGAGATSQWNTASNWKAKGPIETMPENTLVCLFYREKDDPSKMAHTGFGLNNETCECAVGVQHFMQRKAKWKFWAIPAGLDGPAADGTGNDGFPSNTGWRPTIRKGSKGKEVTECQKMLKQLGYDIGASGADGLFGTATQAAVMKFQQDHQHDYRLVVDGVVGPMTWDALDKAVAAAEDQPEKTYSVIIRGLDLTQANAIAANYPGSCEIVEGSGNK